MTNIIVRGAAPLSEVDLGVGRVSLAGFEGIEIKPLSDDMEENARTGGRTRLVRLSARASTGTAQLVHRYWEEAVVLSGDFREIESGVTHRPLSYCCRPPGTPHGPFCSEGGCMLLEWQYFVAESA